MQRSLPKSATILALLLAIPIPCLAWTSERGPVSGEFDDRPALSGSQLNQGGTPFPGGPVTAINVPAGAKKAPVVSTPKPLYLPNVARHQGGSPTPETGLAKLFSFLRPSKGDLEKCFKEADNGFPDRGRSASDPLKKRDRK